MLICLSTVRNTSVFCQNTLVLFFSKKLTQIITLAIQRYNLERIQLVIRSKIVCTVIIKGVSISNEVSTVSFLVVVGKPK